MVSFYENSTMAEQGSSQLLSIPEYYNGKVIFMTGATGFIGKVLVEKLLRSCPGVSTIYCLVRPKRGLSAQERLEKQFNEMMYERLHSEQPGFTNKIIAVKGDVLEADLGLKPEDRQLLSDKVNIVFHSAATVRFDEPLRLAMEMNVIAVRKMIALVKTMTHLESFVHLSTAYANCDRSHIDEQFYPSTVHPQKILDILEWLDDDMLKAITPKLIGNKPNTYTYTKQLAETILREEACDLPLAIVRPSIVTAAWQEPLPGWIDNFNGPSGLYIAAGKGILRSVNISEQAVADMIPVDLPVNLTVAAAWYTAVCKPKQPLICHSTTGALNPHTWGEMSDIVMEFFKRNPLEACFRRPKCTMTSNSMIHDYWVLVSHLIPAYLADCGYLLLGKKPRMVQIYKRLHRSMNTLQYFMHRTWEWSHDNMDMLKGRMNQEDQMAFYFDPRMLHWPSYIENYCLGAKKYILKEDQSGLPAARAHLKKLRNIRYTFNTIVLVVLWRLLIAKTNIARNSWLFIMGLVAKFVRFFHISSTMQP